MFERFKKSFKRFKKSQLFTPLVTLLEGGRRHTGEVRGVDDEGALLLHEGRGPLRRFRAGEVTFEKKPPA